MNWTRNIALGILTVTAVSAFADSDTLKMPTNDLTFAKAAKAEGDILSFPVPKVGLRIGAGDWKNLMIDAGVDVTFNVPFVPLPAIRVDGEVWGETSGFGQDKRGNAVSLLGIQTVALAYYGYGPSYYFTDDSGDRQSGFGLKILGGLSLPNSMFIEASILLGPSSPPIFFSIGEHF